MKRFNSIKKSRKKSKDIDEKIEYLNKECQKTGLNEIANSTDGVYQGTTSNPNSGYAEITGKRFNGKQFAMSGDSNLGQGNFGGASIRADGAALSPPHPVTGERRTTSTKGGLGSGGFKLAIPGERPTPEHRMTGPIMWYWNPSGGGGSGSWESLEYNSQAVHGNQPYPFGGDNAGWGYWGSDFLGFPLLRSDGAAFASLFNTIDEFDPKDSIQFNTVLTKDRIDDPSFLPIDIAGLSVQGFKYLKRKAGSGDDSSDPDDPEGFEKKYGEEEKDNEEQEEFDAEREKLYQENIRKLAQLMRMSENEFIRMAEKLGYMTYLRNILYAKDPAALKIAHKFMVDQYHVLSRILGKISRLPTAANMLVTYDKYIGSGKTGPIDVTNQVDPGSMRKLSKAIRKAKLASKQEMDVLKRIKETGEDRLIKAPNFILGKSEEGFTEMRESEQALRVLAGKITSHLQSVTKPNITIAGFDVGKFLNPDLQQTFHNNVQIDMKEFIKSKGKNVVLTKTYQFRAGGSTEPAEKQWWGKALSSMGVELDRAGVGIYAIPAFIASHMTLKNVGVKHGGKAYEARGMPMRVRIPSNMISLQNSFSPDGHLLTEDVKLGHFEPEVLNVDINDLRKGIMPEFPKDPPPEMINGYSAKSRLLPKKVEGTPFINVTRKDLARNHKLTDKEITEYMNDIKMINDYIKKNPAELLYAMTRYPKHDPRLAQLNWKMDQMKAASDEYMDTHFPENQKLFSKLQDKIIRNINQTDPKNFTGHKEAPKFTDDNVEMSEQRKKTVLKYFKKPVKIKKLFKH